jgi:hypothetical protein
MTRWLVVVDHDTEPRIEGPFKNDQRRLTAARQHRILDLECSNGLFRLDISASGSPRIYHFISREIDSRNGGQI